MHSFDIDIAIEYGVNCAIIIQNLYYWIKKNEANEKHFHDGKYWTYSSVKAFEKLFPYWSSKQITSILHKLEESELIVSGNFNKSPYDRTKWYALTEKGNALFQKENSIFPKGEMKNTKRENENDQKGEPIPNIKTDINTNIKTDSECSAPDAPAPTPEDAESKKKTASRFVPPTVEEIEAYCAEKGYNIDAEKFFDHYSATNWIRNGNVKIKDWKAAVRLWAKNDKEWSRSRSPYRQAPPAIPRQSGDMSGKNNAMTKEQFERMRSSGMFDGVI